MKRSTRSKLALTAGLALAAVPAARGDDPALEGTATAEIRRGAPASPDLLTPLGEYFLAGGGVTNYADDAVRSKVELGGTWDVRLGIGSRSHLGAEAAYSGSTRQAGSLGSSLLTSGAEGLVRVQVPWEAGGWVVEPFAFGGAGWTHFELSGASPAVRSSDDVLVIPFGAGIDAAYDHFLIDARFTYRQTFDESLLATAGASAPNLSSWAVTASLGFEF